MVCELEKELMITILEIEHLNSRIAGQLLTGRDDTFLTLTKVEDGYILVRKQNLHI